ncbi:MAG: tripartite tricarboxylate transporter TctB family protein [Rhodoferax sp.]|uniref:tripartite tricarboxylate transporter TctB family protein n=1 Tax=Rhodoferax sp. TaxID=50421 RepID=UPI0032638AFD
MKTADIVGGLIGMLIGVFIFWQSSTMPTDVVMKIGPGFFPSLLAVALFLFSAVLVVNALRGRSKGELQPLRLSDKGLQRGLMMLAAAVSFVAVLEPLGFIPTSIIFLTLMVLVMGLRKPVLILCGPALITAGVWGVFEKALHLSLPAGILSSIL